MHMDVDNSGPQQTSTSVAAAAGSTRGVLQKITVPSAQAQGLKQVVSSEIFLGSFVIFLRPYSFSLFPWAILRGKGIGKLHVCLMMFAGILC